MQTILICWTKNYIWTCSLLQRFTFVKKHDGAQNTYFSESVQTYHKSNRRCQLFFENLCPTTLCWMWILCTTCCMNHAVVWILLYGLKALSWQIVTIWMKLTTRDTSNQSKTLDCIIDDLSVNGPESIFLNARIND